MKICDEGCKNLVIAIVRQALIDYRESLKSLKKNPNDTDKSRIKNECEIFFSSEYFTLLTNLDGDYLLKNIERMCKNAKKGI